MSVETRIEMHGPMEFVGVALYGDLKSEPADRAWALFGEVADEASISRIGKDIYDLRIYHPRFPDQFEWIYMACLVIESDMEVPIRMITKSLPECRYAIQKAVGGVTGIDNALIYLYQDYIPSHGLQVAMPIDFEKYCKVQDHEKCPDDIEIWVPIKDA
jgi:predicted transcriptional regulator YdeE